MSEEKITGLEFLKDIPKTNDLVSAYGSVNLEQLNNVMKRLKQIPNYNELLKDNEKLSQENKQLKEEIEEYKRIEQADLEAFNNYDSILTELEEWLKENKEICKHNANIISEGIDLKKRLNIRAIIYGDTLDKIQKLKEKYKC